MVVLKLSFERNGGQNTVELINETAGTTNGPINLGEASASPNRSLYLIAKPQGYYASSGKVGIYYQAPYPSTNWIFQKFPNVGQDEDITLKYQTNHQYDGPFKYNGKLMLYPLTRATTQLTWGPMPNISQENLHALVVPEDSGFDVIHTKNLDNASTLGCWVGGYFPKISNSNAPLCVTTYQNTGGSYTGISTELIGDDFSSNGYKLTYDYTTNTTDDLLSGAVAVANVDETPNYRVKVTSYVKYDPNNTRDNQIQTKKQPISINGIDTNFIYVYWHTNLDANALARYTPGVIFRAITSTQADYASVAGTAIANYPMFSYPAGTFTAGAV